MKDKDIIFQIKHALTFAARGGLRASLFVDSVSDDADMIMETNVVNIPKSRKPVVEQAISEWRDDHRWLEHLPDNKGL